MPSQQQVTDLFKKLENPESSIDFFEKVADNVDWWIVGQTPMSGVYKSKEEFLNATISILNGKVLDDPLKFKIVSVIVGGDNNKSATVEMEAVNATCRNGMAYDMRYCWIVRFDEHDIIKQVRAYVDTELLTRAIEQNQ